MTSGISVVMAMARQMSLCFFCDVKYSPDAKFEEHCFNISRDILDWVLYHLCETIYDIITLYS